MATAIGIVPAAGRGTRLPEVDGSKELVPVPGPFGEGEPRPVAEHLLAALDLAGVRTAYVVLRPEKWDIARHFTRSPVGELRLAYLTTPGTGSIPASLDLVYPFARGRTVVTGFADACFEPGDAVARTLRRHREGRAAVTLALFPSDRPDKTDMVEVSGDRVTGFEVKPGPCDLEYTFGAAVWSPEVTELLHRLRPGRAGGAGEMQVSDFLTGVLAAGLTIDAERFPGGRYVDVGTPGDLARVREARVGR